MPKDYTNLGQLIIDQLIAVNENAQTQSTILDINKKLESVTLSTERFTYQGKQVKQIYMVLQNEDLPTQTNSARFILTFENNEQMILRFHDSKKSMEYFGIFKELIRLGGTPEFAFYDRGKCADDWRSMKSLQYSSRERYFYRTIHEEITKSVIASINANANYLQQAKDNGVYIISLGCGDGKDLDVCYNALNKAGFNNCAGMGIDINESLIHANRAQYPEHKFFTGNIENVGKQLDKLTHDGQFTKDGKLVVVISSGSLTLQVMNGTYPVLKILQQLAAQHVGDILVTSGWTDSLITRYGAESSGWNDAPIYFTYDHDSWGTPRQKLIHICQRQSIEEEFKTTLSKSADRDAINHQQFATLDLDSTSNPLEQCAKYLQDMADSVPKIAEIDLSYSHIIDTQIPDLLDLLLKFKNLQNIIISEHEPWAEAFRQTLERRATSIPFKLSACRDSNNPYETRALPKKICAQLGIDVGMQTTLFAGQALNNKPHSEEKAVVLSTEISPPCTVETTDSPSTPRFFPTSSPRLQIETSLEEERNGGKFNYSSSPLLLMTPRTLPTKQPELQPKQVKSQESCSIA